MDSASSLVDLAPLARMLLLGTLLASGPLLWIWLRHRQATPAMRLRALTLLTLFLTFDLVLFGAFTRLTDSGLGCPDWPGCYGAASPLGAHADISAAQSAMPTGPVTFSKAWIEMVHRYLATAVGALITVLAVASWIQRRRISVHWVWPVVTLAWVCLQGAFGALTVTMKLFPAIVTLHLLGGLVLLALLRAQSVAYRLGEPGHPGPMRIGAGLRAALIGAFALLTLQIALGGWVSTNYAVLACQDFPTCHGSWWPQMNWREGFALWRELGSTHAGEAISFPALTAIHYAHRLMAYAVIALLLWLTWACWRVPGLQRFARALLALCAWQFLSGLSNVVLDWPLLAAVGHTGGAAGLVILFTGAIAGTRSETATLPRAARWQEATR